MTTLQFIDSDKAELLPASLKDLLLKLFNSLYSADHTFAFEKLKQADICWGFLEHRWPMTRYPYTLTIYDIQAQNGSYALLFTVASYRIFQGILRVSMDEPHKIELANLVQTDLNQVFEQNVRVAEVNELSAHIKADALALIINSMPGGILIFSDDTDLSVQLMTDKLLSAFGLEHSEPGYTFEHVSLSERIHPDDLQAFLNGLHRGKRDLEVRLMTPLGERWFRLIVSTASGLNDMKIYIAIVINVNYRKEVERKSVHDAMTQLLNREGLNHGMARLRAKQSQLLYCLFDLDHFKHINDTYGHAAGDAVLTCFAQSLTSYFSAPDILARVGGDEFILVSPSTNYASVKERLDSFMVQLKKDFDALAEKLSFRDTALRVSAGAFVGDATQELEHIMKRADTALFEAKQTDENYFVLLSD